VAVGPRVHPRSRTYGASGRFHAAQGSTGAVAMRPAEARISSHLRIEKCATVSVTFWPTAEAGSGRDAQAVATAAVPLLSSREE